MVCLICLTTWFSLAILLIVTFVKWRLSYWKRRKIPHDPQNFPFGNMGKIFKREQPIYVDLAEYHMKMKSLGHQHAGYNVTIVPYYMPIGLINVKNVLVKDSDHFVDRGFYSNERDDPVSAHVFSVDGAKWKNLRAKLSPAFSLNKTKMMVGCLKECAANLSEELARLHVDPLDVKDVLSRYSMDVIATSAFGLDVKTLNEPSNEFRRFAMLALNDYKATMKFGFVYLLPKLSRILRLKFVNNDVSEFFIKVAKNTMQHRKLNGYTRDDFMQILIDMKNEGTLSKQEVFAQAYVFFVAGFNTTSLTSAYCLYELAKNPEMQERARAEIDIVLRNNKGDLDYDALSELKYLNQIIEETLRLYPPVPIIMRVCTKSYKVPNTDVVIEKDTRTLISVHAMHHDPEYFLEPERFDAERFSDENRKKIVPFTYLPFGEGPRVCIALRFSMAQIKIALVTVLRNYMVRMNTSTPDKIRLDNYSLFSFSGDKIILDAIKIR